MGPCRYYAKKIIVFRNGGHLKQFEKWYFKGPEIEIVSRYKYLGLYRTKHYKLWILHLEKRSTRCVNHTIDVDFSQLSFKLFEVIENAQTKYSNLSWEWKVQQINVLRFENVIDCHYHDCIYQVKFSKFWL